MNELPYAEDINYWQTSQTSPDVWMDKTKKLIYSFNGAVTAEGYGSEPATGRAAYMIGFKIGDDRFKVIWPVLPTKTRNERAARIQAATMLYHDIKAKCMSASVLGIRAAFFSYLLLPDGRTATQASFQELSIGIPELFKASVQLGPGDDIVEGEIV